MIFGVERDPLRIGDGAGGGFGGQRDGAVEQGGDLGQCPICYLEFADAVRRVTRGLGQGCDVRFEAVGDGQTSRIVSAAIDA